MVLYLLLPLLLVLVLVPQPAPTTVDAASLATPLFEVGETGRYVGVDVARVDTPAPVAAPAAVVEPSGGANETCVAEGTYEQPYVGQPGSVPGAPSVGLLGVGEATVPGVAAPFPARPAGAMTGSAFLQATSSLSRADREAAIFREIAAGNVPEFLRHTCPISLTFRDGSGRERRGTAHVLPDYLAIGTDSDFVRIPMSPLTAQRLADRFGYRLPTKRLVDATWRAAAYKLRPRPLPPTSQMMSNEWYRRANALVDEELAGRPLGALTAGDKKDVVVTNRLLTKPGRVAIYGWHQTNGSAIQPLSTVHESSYADYSHGVRFVMPTVDVDGVSMRYDEVVTSQELAGLVSDEGPLRTVRYSS